MTKVEVQKAISKSRRREDTARNNRHKLEKKLAQILAREKGIRVGGRYRVTPKVGGRSHIVTVKQIGAASRESEEISVYCHLETKRSVYGSEWIHTAHAEFHREPSAEQLRNARR